MDLTKPIRYCLKPTRIASLTLCLVALCSGPMASAEVGVIIYGSKGMDQRRTGSGHISLIVTDLCADGIDQVRECRAEESPGAVITTYASLATDYGKSVFVVPVLDHFTATNDTALVPVVSSGATLRAAQIEYWRRHLRTYFPPLTQERDDAIRLETDRFDAGRTIRRIISLEFIGTLLASHRKQDSTEPLGCSIQPRES